MFDTMQLRDQGILKARMTKGLALNCSYSLRDVGQQSQGVTEREWVLNEKLVPEVLKPQKPNACSHTGFV